jgi:hypothetical protein
MDGLNTRGEIQGVDSEVGCLLEEQEGCLEVVEVEGLGIRMRSGSELGWWGSGVGLIRSFIWCCVMLLFSSI